MQKISWKLRRQTSTRRVWFELIPLLMAGLLAWWLTIRPGSFAWAGTFTTRVFASIALVGLILSAWLLVRNSKYFVLILILSFIVPCTGVWVWGVDSATALFEPVELLVGGLAWVVIGLILIRPHSVRAVRLAPHAPHEEDQINALISPNTTTPLKNSHPQNFWAPRHSISKWASLPLLLTVGFSLLIAFQSMKIQSFTPDRAILARITSVVIIIALFSVAAEWVEIYKVRRIRPQAKTRLNRAFWSFTLLTALILVGILMINHKPM